MNESIPPSTNTPVDGLKPHEQAAFYNLRSVSLLCVIGAFGSLILSFTVCKPLSPFSIPFYLYSGISLVLVLLILKRRIEPNIAFTFKIFLDALLTVYWIDLYAWGSQSTFFYFLPMIILFADILFNLHFSELRFVHWGIYFLTLGNGILFILFSGNKLSACLIDLAVYYLIAFLTIWAHFTHSYLKNLVHHDLKSQQGRIDTFVNSGKTYSLSTRIVHHEISNELMRLSRCTHLLKKRGSDNFSQEIEEIKHCIETIPRHLLMLSDQQKAPTMLLAILKIVLPSQYTTINLAKKAVVCVPMPLLVSFINNIYENALQAYERKFGCRDGFHIDVVLNNSTLCIEDNAGGFDVSAIKLGKSSKGAGHGIFLATFLKDTRHLGFKASIERIAQGTRVMLTFDQIEIIADDA
jgi:hypothetical protein